MFGIQLWILNGMSRRRARKSTSRAAAGDLEKEVAAKPLKFARKTIKVGDDPEAKKTRRISRKSGIRAADKEPGKFAPEPVKVAAKSLFTRSCS